MHLKILACLFFVLSGCPLFGDDERKPNIVLIMVDDMGFECLNSYGGTSYKTPRLDQIAKQGIQFNHCYSTPLCTPSRVQIMTGKYTFRNYEAFAYLNPSEKTFGHVLKDAGYSTMIAGKWQLNGHNAKPPKDDWQNKKRPLEAGFEECYVWQVDHRNTERFWGTTIAENGKEKHLPKDVYTPDYLVDQICDFMERKKDEPFFVYYPMLLTHAPFIRTPDSESNKVRGQNAFADMVAYTDKLVGRIDDKLEELGLADNTILLFTADNGTDRRLESMLGDVSIPGGKAKTTDAGTHVPLICRWQGKTPEGVKSEQLVDFTDFYPTLAEAAGLQLENGALNDGISFLPALKGEKGREREYSFCYYDVRWGQHSATRFVRDQRYKVYDNGEIFDIASDRFEEKPIPLDQLDSTVRERVQKLIEKFENYAELPSESLVAGPRTDHAKVKPNIILMMADDLGWADVGFNGNSTIKTPHLDAMAKNGMKFNRFYAAAPVCSPTRGSCLTGRHPYRYGIHGANQGHLLEREVTLAEFLKHNGYRTGHFGKWHLGTLSKEYSGYGERRKPEENFMPPSSAGFDDWFSTEYAVATWDPYNPDNAHRKNTVGDTRALYWDNGVNVTEPLEGDDSRIIVDQVLPFIKESQEKDQPFFAVVWFHTPHRPVIAGPEYREMYSEHSEGAQHYYGSVTAMDEQIGRVRNCLAEFGLSDNTLLCFCSDNGPEGKEYGRGKEWGSTGPFQGRKRSLLEGGVRVPAVIEWPERIQPDSQTDFPCVTSDYFPTIVEIVGGERKFSERMDGLSLVRVFDNRLRRRPKPIGFQHGKGKSWIDNQFKYLVFDGKNPKLFDLVKDPGETTNIIGEHASVARRMEAELNAWIDSCSGSATGSEPIYKLPASTPVD